MLKRIKYVSRFAPGLGSDGIGAIIESSQSNNPKKGVTGTLMTSGGLFYQVLEGPPAEVDALYEIIRRDPRHRDVLLLDSIEGVTERLFPRWSLQKIDLEGGTDMRMEPIRALLTAIIDQRESLARMVTALERAVWLEARTPKRTAPAPRSRAGAALLPTG